MSKTKDNIVVLVTAKDHKQAKNIAKQLLTLKLVACVNVLKGVESFFWWDNKIDSAKEVLLVIKSQRSKLPDLIKTVQSVHSYQVPEIIALPIIAGSLDYLRWIDESVR